MFMNPKGKKLNKKNKESQAEYQETKGQISKSVKNLTF